MGFSPSVLFSRSKKTMSILVNKDSRVIVQGFTGNEGTFHAQQMIEYGTNVVGGVTPGKGGSTHLDRPVFNSVQDAVREAQANTSIIFVPPAFAADAIMESAEAGIKVIVCITEGIPTKDMVKVREYIKGFSCTLIGPNCPGIITPGEAKANTSIIFVPPAFAADAIMESAEAGIKVIVCITEGIPTKDMVKVREYIKGFSCTLIGPNCPGIITPGEAKIGIMPGFIFKKGTIGVVSKSGTLTYEAVDQLTKLGLGQSTAIGIGGDPIIGTTTKEAVELFMNDPETEGIVMIGEIGGGMEAEAARWIKEHGTKPVVGFIAGQTAPAGRRMGHAGAIVGGKDDTAAAKMAIMAECGIHVVASPAEIGQKMAEVLGRMPA